ncbi:MAG: hypothetical protein R3F46_11755 [bacterium]
MRFSPTAVLCLLLLLPLTCGCDRLGSLTDNRGIDVADQLGRLQLAVLEDSGVSSEEAAQASTDEHAADAHASDSHATDSEAGGQALRIAVVSVVDQSLFAAASAEEGADPAEGAAAAAEAALRRERQVRQAINARLVGNSLISVVQPAAEQLELARAEVIGIDSAALSQATVMALGEAMHVDYVVSVLIDREGQDVDIVAQHTADGAIVFQETRDWSTRLRVAEAPAAAE